MNLILEKAVDFKKCIDAISVLVDEAEFVIDENNFYLKATDPSQISMIDFVMAKSAFKEYKIDEKTKIGLDLDYLSQIMSRAKSDDALELSLDKDNSKLKITFKGKSTRKFSVPLIDISTTELPSPKIEFDAELKLKAGIIQDGLKDASLISTHIILGVKDDKFFMKANSSKGSLDNETAKGEKSLVELKAKQECQAMFPLDYLQDMFKAANSDTEISLNLKVLKN